MDAMLCNSWLGFNFALRKKAANVLKSRGANRILLSAATLALLLSLGYPSISKWIASSFEPQWPKQISNNALVLKVKFTNDLDCAACAKSIESLLRKQKGLEKAEISFEKDDGVVWFNPEKTSKSAVLEILERNHFPAIEVK